MPLYPKTLDLNYQISTDELAINHKQDALQWTALIYTPKLWLYTPWGLSLAKICVPPWKSPAIFVDSPFK